uniref:Uncharacterized protein n=1 Tax=Urocitellus parryii TaxID=9999 RepID=A0A8D2KEK4_UROPR
TAIARNSFLVLIGPMGVGLVSLVGTGFYLICFCPLRRLENYQKEHPQIELLLKIICSLKGSMSGLIHLADR